MSTAFKNPDNVEVVDISKHRKLRVKANPGFAHAQELHVVAITLSELAECVCTFPVVFIQRPDDGRFLPAVMLGLRTGENIYHGPDFWESTYVPLAVLRHPFVIGYDDRVPNGEEITTCIDISSPFVSEQQGMPLFNEDGQPSEFLNSSHQLLNTMFESQKVTDRFVQAVTALDLLSPFNLMLAMQDGETRKIGGLFTIDEMKMQNLSTEQLRELHQNNFLPACYIILASLHQLKQMIRLRNRKGGRDQIVEYRIQFNPEQPAA